MELKKKPTYEERLRLFWQKKVKVEKEVAKATDGLEDDVQLLVTDLIEENRRLKENNEMLLQEAKREVVFEVAEDPYKCEYTFTAKCGHFRVTKHFDRFAYMHISKHEWFIPDLYIQFKDEIANQIASELFYREDIQIAFKKVITGRG